MTIFSKLQFARLGQAGRRCVPIPLEVVGLVIILIAEVVLTYHLGMHVRGIDLFDGSYVPDGGYRIFSGQLPYRDFHIPVGPVAFYLQAAFFAVTGGFSWEAVILHAAVIGALATAASYLIIRLHLGPCLSLLFACFAVLTFYLPFASPYFDQTAFFHYLLAIGMFA